MASVWSVPGRCLKCAWKVSGLRLDVDNWMVSGGCLDDIWRESGSCLKDVWKVSVTGQVRTGQFRTDQNEIDQGRTGQDGTDQIWTGQVGTGQVGASLLCACQVGSFGTGHLEQVKLGQVNITQDWSSPVKTGEVNLEQVKRVGAGKSRWYMSRKEILLTKFFLDPTFF